MGCNSWKFPDIFPGISIYSTETGSVNTLYYASVSPVSGATGDKCT